MVKARSGMVSEKSEKMTRVKLFLYISCGTIGIISVLLLIERSVYCSFDSWTERGQFGDMFGVGNAIFSALAFGGVIVAIFLQRRELELQRRELELTRREIKRQEKQLHSQADTLKKENLDNTFYRLLSLHQEILKDVTYIRHGPHSTARVYGRRAMSQFVTKLRTMYDRGDVNAPALQRIQKVYDRFHRGYHSQLGHYFRNLYHIMKFIDDSLASRDDKKLYRRLIRAQLSSDELLLLFYNCLSKVGERKFKPLVERFSMLQHILKEELIDSEHIGLYKPQAYGNIEPK